MAEPLLMEPYHDAVVAALKEISWVRNAAHYPDEDIPKFSGLITPAVYFTVNSWDPVANSTGQLSVELSCDLYVVADAAGDAGISQPEIFACCAAADITQWIDGQQFGLGNVEPAAFISAGKDEFDPRMDDYLVWRISFSQRAAFGADPFAPAGGPIKKIWLGAAPEIGAQNVDRYRLIYEANSGDE
ncbi:hypothetical protein [Mixta calida]|uniref:hypothetical protein n=1 Tax=Mixta calida TaxID=665913 RepID=UPI0034D6E07C